MTLRQLRPLSFDSKSFGSLLRVSSCQLRAGVPFMTLRQFHNNIRKWLYYRLLNFVIYNTNNVLIKLAKMVSIALYLYIFNNSRT